MAKNKISMDERMSRDKRICNQILECHHLNGEENWTKPSTSAQTNAQIQKQQDKHPQRPLSSDPQTRGLFGEYNHSD